METVTMYAFPGQGAYSSSPQPGGAEGGQGTREAVCTQMRETRRPWGPGPVIFQGDTAECPRAQGFLKKCLCLSFLSSL